MGRHPSWEGRARSPALGLSAPAPQFPDGLLPPAGQGCPRVISRSDLTLLGEARPGLAVMPTRTMGSHVPGHFVNLDPRAQDQEVGGTAVEWQACLGVLLSGQVGVRDSQAEPLLGKEGRGWVSEHPSRLGKPSGTEGVSAPSWGSLTSLQARAQFCTCPFAMKFQVRGTYQAGLLCSASSSATVPLQLVGAGPGQAMLCRLSSGDSERKAWKCAPLGRPLPAEGLEQLRRGSSRVGGLPAGPGAARVAVSSPAWPAAGFQA